MHQLKECNGDVLFKRGTVICYVCVYVYMSSFDGDWYILSFQCPGLKWQLNLVKPTTQLAELPPFTQCFYAALNLIGAL